MRLYRSVSGVCYNENGKNRIIMQSISQKASISSVPLVRKPDEVNLADV